MPRFIAVHKLPGMTEQKMKEQAAQLKLPPGFDWKLTYCDFKGANFWCDWEAPSKEALEAAFKQQKMPYESVTEVTVFVPSKVMATAKA